MPRKDPLLLTGSTLALLAQIVMAVAALALAIAAPAVLFYTPDMAAKFGGEPFPPGFPVHALAGVMMVGLFIVACLFVFFGRLRAIVRTVGDGDPFQPKNAVRLAQMGWLMLGTQLALVPAAALGRYLERFADEPNMEVQFDGTWDLSGILMVVVLFILARVFRHGAAMRDDLEGTV